MLNHIRPAVAMIALFTLVLGVAYPMAVTGVAQAAFPSNANGSLVRGAAGQIVGSALIGQPFHRAGYLHPRPSAAGKGYDAGASSGANLGPLNPELIARVEADAAEIRADTRASRIPADAVTTSASGLDPHISPAYARLQIARIARARGVAADEVRRVIEQHVEGRTFGVLGQPRVNVLTTNLALDAEFGPLTAKTG